MSAFITAQPHAPRASNHQRSNSLPELTGHKTTQAPAQDMKPQPQSPEAQVFNAKRALVGKAPRLADGLALSSTSGGVSAAKPAFLSAARAPETVGNAETAGAAGAAGAAETAGAAGAPSTVSDVKINDTGTLTFTLYVPSKKAGEERQKYSICVLGGVAAELEGLNWTELAKQLSQTIDLVQNDPRTANFSSITFEGQQSDTNLAKAIVKLPKDSFILGGNFDEVVSGTDKIFSAELDTLLQRLRKLLAKDEVARTEGSDENGYDNDAQPPAPPSTPATLGGQAHNNGVTKGHKAPLKFVATR